MEYALLQPMHCSMDNGPPMQSLEIILVNALIQHALTFFLVSFVWRVPFFVMCWSRVANHPPTLNHCNRRTLAHSDESLLKLWLSQSMAWELVTAGDWTELQVLIAVDTGTSAGDAAIRCNKYWLWRQWVEQEAAIFWYNSIQFSNIVC